MKDVAKQSELTQNSFNLDKNKKKPETQLASYLVEAHYVLGPTAGEDRGEDRFL